MTIERESQESLCDFVCRVHRLRRPGGRGIADQMAGGIRGWRVTRDARTRVIVERWERRVREAIERGENPPEGWGEPF